MTETKTQIEQDAELIEELGGSTAVSDLLNFEKPNGPARVNNWKTRGIPAEVKLAHPLIFVRRPKKAA
jgi:hypothetical protein